jgi:Leucine Rich repeat
LGPLAEREAYDASHNVRVFTYTGSFNTLVRLSIETLASAMTEPAKTHLDENQAQVASPVDKAVRPASHRLRWVSISAFAGLLLLWLIHSVLQFREQQRVIQRIRDLGGHYEASLGGPKLLRRLLGDNWLRKVVIIDLSHKRVEDADLADLSCFKTLTGLYLTDTRITDAGLEHIKKLVNLDALDIGFTGVTDAGLEHIKDLKLLKGLDLTGTEVTDAGLRLLEGLTNLTLLHLGGTRITDDGLAELKYLPNVALLHLARTRIGDAGLVHLKGLTSLRGLDLMSTQITDSGLDHLKNLRELRELFLLDTSVTEDGIAKLKASLPDTNISK